MIPYGRHSLDASDLAAVVQVLEDGLLTGGPQVGCFEQALAQFSGAAQAVVVSSGTAALHLAYQALGLGPGDEVIVPAITFAATANAALYCGARPVFADVLADSLLIDPASVEACISPASRALVAVDYAGQPCDYAELSELAQRYGLHLVADACHSLGASYQDRPVGQLADVSCLSFHPVKPITSGEGGALLCQDAQLAERLRRLRNHGLDSDFAQREGWQYAMLELGYNYRLTDIQCALGLSQLQRLPDFIARRQAIARRYAAAFAALPAIQPLGLRPYRSHGYHLYVARLPGGAGRWFQPLRRLGLGVNVHYQPVYLHPYYQQLGYAAGLCPQAERAYTEILSLPLYPAMSDAEVEQVIHCLCQVGEEIGL